MNLVSIIVPIYNQEKFLAETLHSILKQTYSNWECILVNDGSTDDSIEVIKKFLAQDNRFHFINSENKGVSHARNLALKQIKGDFILFLDGDDLIHSEKIAKAISNFENDQQVSIVFNTTNYFLNTIENTLFPMKLDASLMNYKDLLLYWNEKIIIPIHSAIISKSLFEGIEFNTDLTAQEDWLVWLRLFQKNPKVIVNDEVLSYYRKHNSSRTQSYSLIGDHIKALKIFENYVEADNYNLLLLNQIERYYTKSKKNGTELNAIKASKTYRTSLFIKKVLIKFGLFKIIKFLTNNMFKNAN